MSMQNQDTMNEDFNWKDLPETYFPALTEDPFQNKEEEKEYYLRFLDLLLALSVYQREMAPGEAAGCVGVLFPDAELMRSLEPSIQAAYSGKEAVRDIFHKLLKKGTACPLSRLFLSELLEPIEILAFLLAYSVSASRKYEKLYAVLSQQTGDSARPTIGLCIDFARFFLFDSEIDAGLLFHPDSFLNKALLVKNSSILLGELARPLILRDAVLYYVNGLSAVLGGISRCGMYLEPHSGSFTCHPDKEEELRKLYQSIFLSDRHAVVEVCGEGGCGKRFLLGRLGTAEGQSVLAIDIQKLLSLSGSMQETVLADTCIKMILDDDLLYLYGVQEAKGWQGDFLHILSYLQDYLPLFYVGTEKPLPGSVTEKIKGRSFRVDIPPASVDAQKQLWRQACEDAGAIFADDIKLEELVSKYTMNPGRIFSAVTGSTSLLRNAETEAGPANAIVIEKKVLEENIRRICAVQLGDNAKRIESPFVWDDLILDEKSKKLLRLACDRICFRSRVNVEYGFGRKLPYGRGVAIVFYGPPGTGKTMAAQVFANELGLDIYRIDLSQVSSKYIGDTEKNLGTVFDEAKNSNAILFFDEADSLFSKRTAVSSSNDKHANAETSYLLQKIEEYTGVSILATNNLQNFDAAFKRRMTYLIPIGIPDEETREKMWQAAFPPEAPLADDVRFSVLARAVELTGSNIKNCAIAAAYFAAAEDRKITMNDIAEAAELESLKIGKLGAKKDILAAMAAG